ncbi:hypothetical protein N7G274_006029 [Stereocaulon virgatum]|uniref:NADH-plastoquinone oxidoreductase subunit K n=1 Tax=Stereocaulon virgatum TaxID=373712 RepID=A0ABR4A7M4_9LECA
MLTCMNAGKSTEESAQSNNNTVDYPQSAQYNIISLRRQSLASSQCLPSRKCNPLYSFDPTYVSLPYESSLMHFSGMSRHVSITISSFHVGANGPLGTMGLYLR